MRLILQSIKVFFIVVIFNSILLSQTGKISGKITDKTTGETLPFVTVVVEGTTQGAASDVDGIYNILNVRPGVYTLKASAIGYNTMTVQNVKVSVDLTTKIDFELMETTLQIQEVVVTAIKPLIQKDMTASTSIVNDELISSLPVTEVNDILQLQAGITKGSGGDLHIRGGRSGQISYRIDGVPMTDSYNGSNVIDISTNSIQELQVISGAFNAEYGQAMSGVVNIVTKDGDNKFTGTLQSYIGQYASNRDNVFWNITKINPTFIRNFEGSFSGPVIPEQLFFFLNGRYFYNSGYLFGVKSYLTTDVSRENSQTGGFDITKNGDSSFVSMNPNERIYGQGKLTFCALGNLRFSINHIIDKQNYQDYNHYNKLTPDNNLKRFRLGYATTFNVNHAISSSSFYTFNLSYFYTQYKHYLFEDIYTDESTHKTQYVDNRLLQNPPYNFAVGGTDYSRFYRNTGTYSAKLDFSSQVNNEIALQVGGEYKMLRVYSHSINLIPLIDATGREVQPFSVMVPPITTTENNEYLHKPKEYSGYVQSKFEAFNLIFNIGVRFDAFDPDGVILSDPSDPNINNPLKPANQFFDNNGNGVQDIGERTKTVEDRMSYWYKKASIKYQFSPRIGLAFPISDKGVIHFSYGHFFQLPSYELLYNNPEFELGSGSGNQGLFGNADLRPQKTVKGEIGLQQQIGNDMAVDATVFFEDFRDLTGTQTEDILVFGGAQSYSKYTNSDFGFSKGFIIKFEKRFGGGLAANLDYTYSETKGNASNPSDARNAVLGGALPETFIAPLDWNQTHTLNISVAYSVPKDYGFSIIGNFYSGQPYTPSVNKNTRVTQNGFPRNSADKPTIFNIDLRTYKDFEIGSTVLTVFLKVYNLLDLENPRNVNSDTGDPYFSFGLLEAKKINPKLYNLKNLEQLYTDPGRFSEPRRVELGVSYNF